ncbi:long-chain fatty acid transporter [Desulfonema ishimotonii]|uniref:Long-chain fatty acid transporter n=1 Tax=Desulfonema ishimotonii TaxID=45657 RepID=A0A401FY20_9BACT|nr:outer membrane protein transport protein [Desulfonema ishimotonii]GBC61859.1 long-chain fatty acid transporter [Desulfonema ishimotonii]
MNMLIQNNQLVLFIIAFSKSLRIFFFITAVLLAAEVCTNAANVDTFGIGSKATALGGAFSAYADDPYAIHYNPAGLTRISRITISGGTHLILADINVGNYHVEGTDSSVNGSKDFSNNSDGLVVPHFGFVYPLSDKLVTGIAAYAPYGLDIEFDDNTAENPGAFNNVHSYYNRMVITPAISYRFSEKISGGFGISVGRSECGVERLLYLPGTSFHEKKVETELEDDFNYSFNAGIMYTPTDSLTLGLTFRSKADADFEGSAEVVGIPGSKTDIESSIDHPAQVQGGIRYQPHSNFSLELDLVWTDWSTVDCYIISFTPPLLGVQTEDVCEREWEDTVQVRIGAEWALNDMVVLRGGYFYDPSPVPDKTFDLQWPDSDKKTYSFGMGLNFGNFSVDSVVQYIITEKNRYIGGESVELNRSYGGQNVSLNADGEIWGFGITFNYVF